MKKGDLILAVIILAIAGVGLLFYRNIGKTGEGFVTVTVDGKVYGTYSLKEDREIPIHDTNYLMIQNGQADMVKADCPDQICVNQKPISKEKESIICLPNRVVVEIVGGEEADLDAVAD